MMDTSRTPALPSLSEAACPSAPRKALAASSALDWTRLEIRNVSKSFTDRSGRDVCVLSNISLTIERGDFYCLLGPSGCGKSTLLNMIGGFEAPSSGSMQYVSGGEKPLSRPLGQPSSDRVTIFQDASQALFPWMTAEENVMFGPRMAGVDARTARESAQEYLHLVGLGDAATKYPWQLSGGMRQRLQLARGLIMKPQVLLMDEPFGALDAITRRSLQDEMARIWHETGATIVFITHDITEALLLGNRVAVMTIGPAAEISQDLYVNLSEPRTPTNDDLVHMQVALEGDIRLQLEKAAARAKHQKSKGDVN